ncbi:MAG TPA: SDR family NAD(P)-dependent oxidoreductase [Pseudonocardiaceae bacterium]|jgi:NAD(P)-dependent dehydrogenase (short-subunit alcohol dehydrogenase family)|nr:SDR family NAD(P)-dependent oxidoreductase [Pseudonocardiaceae bacterium]
MRLKDKVAIIFGGGQLAGRTIGNGKAVALMFAREGAKVFVVDINKEAADETVAEIRAEGGTAEAFQADVTDEPTVEAAITSCHQLWGRIDILHNNVGISIAGGDAGITDITVESFDRVIAVNLRGMVLTIKHTLPIMRQQRFGSIINISSAAAFNNYPYVGYKTSKAAVLALTSHVAIRNAEYGIRANTILPGLLNTPVAVENRMKKFGLSYEEVVAQRDKEVPLRRKMGTAWDIAYAAVFLASDEANFITGVDLPVDGGQSRQIGRAPAPYEAAEEQASAAAAAAALGSA